jgi:predicted NAD/FAD-dependent oxidoreductase
MNVAIIGAGVAGLSAARDLSAQGVQVQLFDKSRGVGGRMTTRYAGDWEFDHGAQYFTVSDDGFRAEIDAAISAGVVAPWPARAAYLKTGLLTADTGRPRYVGSPRMNSLPKHWAQGLDIALGRRVSAITRGETWSLAFEDGTSETGFDAVICTLPPAQAQDILPADFAKMAEVKAAKMHVCFTLMVGLKTPIDPGFDTLRVKDLVGCIQRDVSGRRLPRGGRHRCGGRLVLGWSRGKRVAFGPCGGARALGVKLSGWLETQPRFGVWRAYDES